MDMTVDEQIKALEYLKKCGIFPFSDTRTGIVITDEYVDGAIDTMRKYQKIQQILKSLDDGEINYPQMTYYLREVLEDGNGRQQANG